MSNITAYFGETIKSGSGVVATADYSGTTSVSGLYGPTGVGGFASGQFQFVTIEAYSGTGSSSASLAGAVINTVAGAGGLKLLGNKPQQGDPCQLFDIGEVKVVAGAALTVGQLVMSDANGRAVPWVDEDGNVPVAECRVPANSANDICTIFMYPNMAGAESLSATAGITAHAGGGQSGAVQLTTIINQLSVVATAADSVKLPPAILGSIVYVANSTATSADVYANGTDTINGGSAGGEVAVAAAGLGIFLCYATGAWSGNVATAV